jgi:hypothetical protein
MKEHQHFVFLALMALESKVVYLQALNPVCALPF